MKKIFFCLLAASIYGGAEAQTTADTVADHKTVHLKEMVVSANKTEEDKSEIPFEIGLIKSKDVILATPQTSADMLMNTGGVFVQKSQQGGGSPALRGFEASRVLAVVDGVRMNNAIYRAGHLQDVITIDNSMIERTEIVFGPSSSIYGSDALGGVMHFYTKKPLFSDSNKMLLKGNTYLRWSSANNEKTGHLDLNVGGKRFSSLTGFTFSDFGDLRSGKRYDQYSDSLFERRYYVKTINGVDSIFKNPDINLQKITGYTQHDFLQKFAFKQSDKILHTLNFQYSNSSNIPRYDRLTENNNGKLRFAEWYYGPQTRMFTSLNTQISASNKFFEKLNLIVARQAVSQDRISRSYRNPNRRFQMEDLVVYSLNADFVKFLNEKHELRYGLEGTYNDVKSVAKNENIKTNEETPYQTRYPDGGSSMASAAAYLSHKWNLSEKVFVSDGIRFSASTLHSKFVNTAFFPFPFNEINQNTKALTGNLGIVFKPSPSWKLSLLGSSGFRTPNVDDLTKVFDSAPGKLVVANPDLKPEHAFNVEIGIEKTFAEKVKIAAVAWNTKMVNAMVLKNYRYDGKDSVMYDGKMSQIQAMQNAANGYIQGVTATFMADINTHFSFTSTLTYTYGRYNEKEKGVTIPLDHISPVFGKTAVIFNTKKLQSQLYALYNGAKALKNYSPSGEDNLQYATPTGTPAWMTLNFKAAYQASKNLMLQAGVENILDTHYRYFASGISAPGRNFTFTLRSTL